MTAHFNKHRLDDMYFKILLIFSGVVCICAERSHELCHTFGCFESSDTHLCMTLDGNEVYYADFGKECIIWESSMPTDFHISRAYQYALMYRYMCKVDKQRWKSDPAATKSKEPPEIIIYPREEVVKMKENILICYINRFFPPSIKITWTKNDKEVIEEDPFKKILANPDGTYHIFSSLNFVPNDGDIYSCSVEHEALQEPGTKIWEVEFSENGNGPAIFCGLGLSLGILGVVAGSFFFVKGSQYHGVVDPAG